MSFRQRLVSFSALFLLLLWLPAGVSAEGCSATVNAAVEIPHFLVVEADNAVTLSTARTSAKVASLTIPLFFSPATSGDAYQAARLKVTVRSNDYWQMSIAAAGPSPTIEWRDTRDGLAEAPWKALRPSGTLICRGEPTSGTQLTLHFRRKARGAAGSGTGVAIHLIQH